MQIHTEQLKPGMTLQEDVLLPGGAILLRASQQLSAPAIDILRKKGVRSVAVSEGKTPVPSPAPTTTTEKPFAKPKLTLMLSDDLMSAGLLVEPLKEHENILTHQDIMDFLAAEGITHGIREPEITAFLKKWAKLVKPYEVGNIVAGTPAQPGREGNFSFVVRRLNDERQMELTRNAKHIWDVNYPAQPPDRVDLGTVVAKRAENTLPIPGINIRGDPVFTEELIKISPVLDGTVQLKPDGTEILARITGVAFEKTDRTIGVLPLNFDGDAVLEITAGNLIAILHIKAPGERGVYPGKDRIQELLVTNGIKYGVKLDVLQRLYAGFQKNECPVKDITVAEALLPKNGEDGKIDFLFNIESSLKPKLNQDGSADYKNVEMVRPIAKGTELVKLTPPTKGAPGMDVLGRPIPCKDGDATRLPQGANTEPKQGDPNVLIAVVDGNVKYEKQVVEVSEGFIIKGDVDFSSGNVKYEKSVTVGGDLRTGFSVECGGDLQVNGTIEDSQVTAGGNVLCKYGFVGQGRGIITARGDVNISFIKNQTVKTRGSVNIAREALGATIYARHSITLHGNPVSIAGGSLIARDSISLYTIGNSSGIRTSVEVGLDYSMHEEIDKTQAHIKEATESLSKIQQTYKKFDQLVKMRRTLPPKDQELFTKIKETMIKYIQEIKLLEKRIETIKTKMYEFGNCFIKIEHAAMPGTLIKIGERSLFVKEEIIGPKMIRFINFEIRVL